MAATDLTPISALGGYQSALTALALTAADVANGNAFVLTGRELILIFNSGASSRTVTLTSVADPYGRSGTITAESIPAGEYRIFGPVPTTGWQQTSGKMLLSANHAEVKFAIIRLPG